ncbi:MAG: amidohydrolase [Bacteroidales bacterium]|nr:amidohydrolase [Bacteroidales bacterium]MDD4602449.1 amidohydrolase [Bacteroidales bacterium]
MKDLKISLIQTTLFWEESRKNLDHFAELLNKIIEPSDLILLPEMFNTGFSINPAVCAEKMDGTGLQFLKDQARKKNAFIMATLLIKEGDDHFNRLVCMAPDGTFQTYDKRHLFRLSEEYKIFKEGMKQLVVNVNGWKIHPVICYDLRFPVWCKNTYDEGEYGYDLLVCTANWPASRSNVWKTMLKARAMENQSFVAGVNRIGDDGNGTWHSGDSMVLDAKGNILWAAESGKEGIQTINLSATDLKIFRDSFTVGMDWDKFTINVNS